MKTTHLIRSLLLLTLTWSASAYGVVAPSADLDASGDDWILTLDCPNSKSCAAWVKQVGSRLHVFPYNGRENEWTASSERLYSFAYEDVDKIIFSGSNENDYFKNETDIPVDARGKDGNDIIYGGGGDDEIEGGGGDDDIWGGDGDDEIDGESGKDEISGGNGNDKIWGGKGGDYISGNSGNDTLLGQKGEDTLRGGDGNDVIEGGDDRDKLFGGNDDDTLKGGGNTDTCDGGSGTNQINSCEN